MQNAASLTGLTLLASACLCAQTSTADRTAPVFDPLQPPTRDHLAPVTEKKRLHEYVKSWISPVSFLSCAASAGWGQLRDAPVEWGEGDEALAKRFVSAYGQHLVDSTLLLTGASLFHEENRYVPSGRTENGARLAYALESSILARHDDPGGGSHRRVSFSRIAAFAGAALISRTWQPPSSRGVSHAAVSFATSIAVTAGFNVVREFLSFK